MAPGKTSDSGNNSGGSGNDVKRWIMGDTAFAARMPHHDGIKALWETKWKFPCIKSVYPFHDGKFEDFEPIFDHLLRTRTMSTMAPPTTPRLHHLPHRPFPLHHGLKAASAWADQVSEALVPHVHAKGNDRPEIPVYVRVPTPSQGAGGNNKFPTVILMTGLDGYRPDNTVRLNEFLARGWASVTVEIPGTADCPADSADPESPDRLWTSLLEWMAQDGRFDMKRVMVWGISSGGYYAVRIAHTHKDHLIGSVAQGAGTHYFFNREWLDKVDGHEYPFVLTPELAMKHGYNSVQEYKDTAQSRFSLLDTGILDKPSTRLLLINGTLDGLMPIEDSLLLFEHGTPKEGRFFQGALHMGYPMANASVYPWMESIIASVQQ